MLLCTCILHPNVTRQNLMRSKKLHAAAVALCLTILTFSSFAQTESDYFSRGQAALDRKDYDDAVAQFSNVLSLRSDYAEAYNNRGLAYFHKGQYDSAIGDFNRAIQYKPS